jgi:EpsI family protein
MNNKSFFVVVTILVIAAIISYIFYRKPESEGLISVKMSDFPMAIGEWSSQDIPLSERVYELLETRNLIMRNYTNQNGESVNLYIIYSPDNRKVNHPPEICLQGEGAIITNKTPIQITKTIRATKLMIEKGLSRDLVVYWYKAGTLNTNSYLLQQLKHVLGRFSNNNTSVAMVRISADVDSSGEDIAIARIKTFANLIEPILNKYVP